jgi:hypothetical protein
MNAVVDLKQKLAYLVHEFKKIDQVDCPVTHRYAPGVYLREIFMPAGSIVIGKIHKTEHFNILLSGSCLLRHDDGTVERLESPRTFVSKAGVQKVLYILTDMTWQTVHVTDETDLEKLEELLIEPMQVPQELLT